LKYSAADSKRRTAAVIHFRIRPAVAVAALIWCALACSTPGDAARVRAAQTTPAASSPSIKTSANLVLVDVVATDHGKPVLDIARDRFRIFENGKERPIIAFDQHHGEDASAAALAAQIKTQIASLPAHTFTNLPLYPATGATNVLLLDALNTPMADQAQARYQMIQYMKNIPQGAPIAIFTLSSHLRMIEGFTTDAAQLAAVLKGSKASPSQSVVSEPQSTSAQMAIEQEMANLDSPAGPPSPEVLMAMQDFESDLTTFQTDLRVRMTLDAFDELARYLSLARRPAPGQN
jgi:VWFA-related protein